MRKREPITEESVFHALSQMTEDQARANSGFILRPFENAWYVPATSRPLNDDEFYAIERNEGFFTNTETLRGSERRMHVLGTVTTRTFVVPETLPKKHERLWSYLLGDTVGQIAVASVSIVSMYPIRIKTEHASTVRVPVDPTTAPREAAAMGVAAFLNGSSAMLSKDEIADFEQRLEATRAMARADSQKTWELLDNYRQKLRHGRQKNR